LGFGDLLERAITSVGDPIVGAIKTVFRGGSLSDNIAEQRRQSAEILRAKEIIRQESPWSSRAGDTLGVVAGLAMGTTELRLLKGAAELGAPLVRGVAAASTKSAAARTGATFGENGTDALVAGLERQAAKIEAGTAESFEGRQMFAARRTPGRGAPPEAAEAAAGPSAAGNVAANSARSPRAARAAEKTAAERAEKLAYAKQLKEAGLDGETVAAMVTQEFSKPTGWMGMVPSWIRNSTVVVGLLGAGAGVFYAATHLQDLAADLGLGRMKVPFTDWNLFGLRGHAKAGELEATAGVAKPVEARTDTAEPHPAATETEAQKALRLKRERQKAEGFEDHSSLGVSSPTLTSLDEKVGTRASLRLASVTDTVGEGTRDLKGQPVKANTPIAPSITA
jgi:hypothetical protein